MGKHVFEHGDGVAGGPEVPDLALGPELLERAYAVVSRLLDVPVSVIPDIVQLV
jgi:hypothetical protein